MPSPEWKPSRPSSERGSFTAAASVVADRQVVDQRDRAGARGAHGRPPAQTARYAPRTPDRGGHGLLSTVPRLLMGGHGARRGAGCAEPRRAGRLRVATPDAFAQRYIVPGLPAFLSVHPRVEIDLIEGTAAARLVDEGIDLAIRIVAMPEPSLVVRRIAMSQVGDRRFAGLSRQPRHADEAARRAGASPDRLLAAAVARHLAPGQRDHRGKPGAADERAASRCGLRLWQDWASHRHRMAGRRRARPRASSPVFSPDTNRTAGSIYAVYPSNRLLTPTVRAFVDHLARDLRARGLPR